MRRPQCVTAKSRAGGGCGVTARRQWPAPCAPSAEAAGQAAAHNGETPLRPQATYGAAPSRRSTAPTTLACAHCISPAGAHGSARRRRALEAVRREVVTYQSEPCVAPSRGITQIGHRWAHRVTCMVNRPASQTGQPVVRLRLSSDCCARTAGSLGSSGVWCVGAVFPER